MGAVLVLLTLGLAFANGANDVSKGIATLVGSGTTGYRAAVAWGAGWTVAGGLAAAFASQGLVATFSGKGLLARPAAGGPFLLAVAAGAIGWLLLANATGLPVSTTHALAGALAGAGLVAVGSGGILWSGLAAKIALPLALSPLVSLGAMLAVSPLAAPLVTRFQRFCVCVERREDGVVTPGAGAAAASALPAIEVVAAADCPPGMLVRVSLLDSVHWVSSGATSFFRGLNDTPKILALGVASAGAFGASTGGFFTAVALAMGAGSILGGFRVTDTLATKVTKMSPGEGLLANVTTSALVGAASFWSLPVSTTHVSTGAIVGIGAGARFRAVRRSTLRDVLFAWVVTLPVAAALAALAFRLLS